MGILGLPPIPMGDPEGMRAFAAGLRFRADSLDILNMSLGSRIASMAFEGPAASRFKDEVTQSRVAITGESGSLRELSNEILQAAATLEHEFAEWRSIRDRLAEEVKEAAAKAIDLIDGDSS